MDGSATASSNTGVSAKTGETAKPISGGRPSLRLFVPTLMLIVFWTVTECSYRLEMGMFYRFVTRMIALLVLLLFFLFWGFSRRHFSLAQRGLTFLLIIGTMSIAGLLGDTSTGVPATAMVGLPIVLSLSVAWLWYARSRGFRLELIGIAAASTMVFGTIALLRWDGMEGRQRAQLSWRWTLKGEDRFRQAGVIQTMIPAVDQRPQLEETVDDWLSFRGGDREGVVSGITLPDWTTSPPKEVWRRRVGPGWSSVIAVGDYLFTQEQREDREAVICYNAKTGDEVWVHSSQECAERFEDSLSGTGPRATPTFHQNRIYSFGAKGQLECLDAVTGQPHWSQAVFKFAEASIPQWGSSTSPTIVDDLVVVFAGGKGDNGLLAFDRLTGELRWKSACGTISYSTPQIMTLGGQRQIVMHDDAGLNGIDIQDGKTLWHHPSPNAGSFQPMLQIHLTSTDQFIVNWDAGLLCLKVHRNGDDWKIQEMWKSNKMKPSFNDFVIHAEHIYGLDDGILACVDLEKGRRKWKGGRYGFGQMLLLPETNELLIVSERGELIRVAADPKEHRELGQVKAIEGKTWNHPSLAHGRLVVRNSEEMACFELRPKLETAKTE